MEYPAYVAALDIGGTKIAGALLRYEQIDAAPEVVFETQVPTQAQRGGGPVLVTVCDVANTVLAEARSRREQVLGIGVSTAGRVDAVTGGIAYANEIMPGWTGQPIKERLEESCELPVSVLNDVQAHALGEARWGAASGADTCMMIAAGTGIGGAVIAHGRLVRGNHGFAGEIGHIACSQAVGIPCVCGGSGHLELVASGSGIEARYAEITGNHIDGAEISRRAAEGEPAAHKVIMTAGIALGEAIAGITNLLDPDMVVIGGSVPKAGTKWRAAVQEGFERQIPLAQRGLPILAAELGGHAPLIGAAEDLLDFLEDVEAQQELDGLDDAVVAGGQIGGNQRGLLGVVIVGEADVERVEPLQRHLLEIDLLDLCGGRGVHMQLGDELVQQVRLALSMDEHAFHGVKHPAVELVFLR